MLTATKDLLLPTTVTGSWPRPAWYTENLSGRPLSSALNDLAFREQFLDATGTVIADQEFAGLDILTNGDYHLDADFAGRSWHAYPLQRLGGVSDLDLDGTSAQFAARNGTWMNEIMAGWRFPAVVDKVGPRIPFEFAKIWRIAQSHARRPVKFGTNTADLLASVLNVHADIYSDDKRELMWDIATVINAELRDLVAAGCEVVQIEDPMIHNVASGDPELTDFLVDLFNYQVEGLEDAEVWVHTCWGNPGGQGIPRALRSYAASIDIYLGRLNVDVWQIESKDSNHAPRELFRSYDRKPPTKVAVGLVNHRALQVEGIEEVADDVRRWLEVIDAEHLILSSDCGFGRQGVSRPIAFYKASALAQGVNIVRRELGLPETEVRAAEASRQIDPSPFAGNPQSLPLA